ncbi:predicted protease [Chthonomonas calidirosea]|uniref:Predicted protease n=1 Tax=Chthonomonas calidirosea (strain DSM 23976 / ICMP 18418 / T49) TaxID=1303518 RepID=S0EZ98_CHTCT|nr:S53 family peptidase [Chthonomonas calidirosea]CCW36089.1 Predicted protease [Chthonomonas calidirosea T49]CEK18368.1 predicted protease [Chthonomonas calidirosea]
MSRCTQLCNVLRSNRAYGWVLFLVTIVLTSTRAVAQAPLQRLPGHLPSIMALSHPVARTEPNEVLSLTLVLPLHHQQQLQQLIQRLYDPSDPLYGHYLTPQQFTALFSPTPQEYAQVASWAQAQGFRVVGIHRNRLLLDVEAPASTVEKAFGLHLLQFVGPDGRLFRAPDRNPEAPPVPLAGVVGLDTAADIHPFVHVFSQAYNVFGVGPRGGTGPNGGLSPSDIKTAYSFPTAQTGAGQTLGLLELDGYNPSDILGYENYFHLPNVPLQNVLIDGFDGKPGSGAIEVTFDIELMVGLAPGASRILVYEGPNTASGYIDTWARIANDNLAKQVSTSWGAPEDQMPPSIIQAENIIFMQMATQGQTVYAASGDNGAYDDGTTLSVDDPASQPYMVGTGGTRLYTVSPGGAWSQEIGSVISGGGISAVWSIPSYQQGMISAASKGSTTMRNVPDVALNSDIGYAVLLKGSWINVGGTSACAPSWAAFTALVNEARAQANLPPLGFANPALYAIARNATHYAQDFHDITIGNNKYYQAVPGYDDVTGLGTPIAANLLTDLASASLPSPTPTNLIGNPGFEQGASNPAPWQVSSPSIINDSPQEPPHSGQWDAWLGGHNQPQTDTLEQLVTFPTYITGIPYFSFYLHIDTQQRTNRVVDTLTVQFIDPNTGRVMWSLPTFSNLNARPGYFYVRGAYRTTAFSGKTLLLRITARQTTNVPTNFVVDDFSLTINH